MVLCARCHENQATIGFIHKVNGEEKVNVHLCESCARPMEARLEASRQGQQKCAFCDGAAFTPLPGAAEIIYACCGCRAEYARIFLEICALRRPELLERSRGEISFFSMSFDPEVEDWSAATSRDVVVKLKATRASQENGKAGEGVVAAVLTVDRVRDGPG